MDNEVVMAVVPENACKVVSDPTIARKLIKQGFNVIDIKPKKRFPRETVFVFEVKGDFMAQLNQYLEEKQDQ